MATDVLVLGALIFDDWSTPGRLPYGGKQAMAVHKLPGGNRVVDTLGPDENDINFSGTFWGTAAFANATVLHAMRIAGLPVPLSFGGMAYSVIVEEAIPVIERFPNFVTYNVSCLVVVNATAGLLGAVASTVGSLISADLATAMSIVGL